MVSHQGIMDSNYGDKLLRTSDVELIIRAADRKRDRRKKEYWNSTNLLISVYILAISLLFFGHIAKGFVIAPPWANPEVNICSKKSWQLIYWPQDQKCYQIFEQGPCPRSQVFIFIGIYYEDTFLTFKISIRFRNP